MKIKINGTNKTIELHDIDPMTGVDCVLDTIGNSGAIGDYIQYDRVNDVYTTDQGNADWWRNYLDLRAADAKAMQALRRVYCADDIERITQAEWYADGNDYNMHHDINLRVIERIKAEARRIDGGAEAKKPDSKLLLDDGERLPTSDERDMMDIMLDDWLADHAELMSDRDPLVIDRDTVRVNKTGDMLCSASDNNACYTLVAHCGIIHIDY